MARATERNRVLAINKESVKTYFDYLEGSISRNRILPEDTGDFEEVCLPPSIDFQHFIFMQGKHIIQAGTRKEMASIKIQFLHIPSMARRRIPPVPNGPRTTPENTPPPLHQDEPDSSFATTTHHTTHLSSMSTA